MKIKLNIIAIVISVLLLIFVTLSNADDNNLTELDYLDIAYDLYFHPDDCEGQKIIARGLWYFIGGGEQIANYTNIDDYYNAGIVWAKEYCG